MQTAIKTVMNRQGFKKFTGGHVWKFAETVPHNPHYYILKKDIDFTLFESAAGFIKDNGFLFKYGQGWQPSYNFEGSRYWIEKKVEDCQVIKRFEIQDKTGYDQIARDYDRIISTVHDIDQAKELMKMIGRLQGSVLDVGSGTGRLLDFKVIDHYIGVEPSMKMIEAFQTKHKKRVFGCRFKDLPKYREFDNVVALGSGSYIEDLSMFRRFWNGKGQLFITFNKEGFVPEYFKSMTIQPEVIRRNHSSLMREFQSPVIEFGNYYIIQKRLNGFH